MAASVFQNTVITKAPEVPQYLRDLSVVEIQREQSRYSLRFHLQFDDGDTLSFDPNSRAIGDPTTGEAFMTRLTDAIREHRQLPT